MISVILGFALYMSILSISNVVAFHAGRGKSRAVPEILAATLWAVFYYLGGF